MILIRGNRQQAALRAVNAAFKPSLSTRPLQRRHFGHRIPQLTHTRTFAKNGIPNLLSPEGFEIAWTQYQGYLVEKLNQMTAGTEEEHALTKTILLKYARRADRASLFNHASMAHNNHLFFSTLTPNAVPDPIPIPPALEKEITASFSSTESFRQTFLATANAMFGPGFVWLVRTVNPLPNSRASPLARLSILTTYIAGSPYPGAHFRQQPTDMATANTGITVGQTPQEYATAQSQNPAGGAGLFGSLRSYAGTIGPHARNHNTTTAPGGQNLEVLLCVNTWEHVFLRDWGVSGKQDYLEAWWASVDWKVVGDIYDAAVGAKVVGFSGYGMTSRRYMT